MIVEDDRTRTVVSTNGFPGGPSDKTIMHVDLNVISIYNSTRGFYQSSNL